MQKFRDQRSLPRWDVDVNGTIKSAFEGVGYMITDTFTLQVIDLITGKKVRNVSSKASQMAVEEYRALKKEVSEFYKKRIKHIRSAYITAEMFSVDHWLETYAKDYRLLPITKKILWCDSSGETFIVRNGKICTFENP